jgi:hypothetical protein
MNALYTVALTAFFMTSFLPSGAQAADPTDGKSGSFATQKILCDRTYIHTPTPDVAYQPGVDAQGNPVVPADINPSPISVPSHIEVPLTVDLATRLSLPTPEGVKMEDVLGALKLHKDGKVEFNGVDLTPVVAAVCGWQDYTPPAETPMTAPEAPQERTVLAPEATTPGGVALSSTEAPKPPRILWPGGKVPESFQMKMQRQQ